MTLSLGIDTGGTFTDAVLMAAGDRVLAKAKALTTRPDLAPGIGEAVGKVLAGQDPGRVTLVALSTTLATNALVEGHGGRVALVAIGFAEADLDRAGLRQALGQDPVIRLGGGHNHAGQEAAPFDEAVLIKALARLDPPVSAFAIAAHFATRNPGHEQRARDAIRARTGLPVTCSHELAARLNGPRRALTALLNARLIGMIGRLTDAAAALMDRAGITAPLMVVRGDGALITASEARERPIETILSGPAASLVGASWLTGAQDALVADIGGTTTDAAVLRAGRPGTDPEGALVGGHHTMVAAVAMRTTGLGGDSEVRLVAHGLWSEWVLGPRRRVPLALAALSDPETVHAVLDRQLAFAQAREWDGQFALALGPAPPGLAPRESALIGRLQDGLQPLETLLTARPDLAALDRLVALGLVQVSSFTPSDAAHVLNRYSGWDGAAAEKGARLLARVKSGGGEVLARDAEALARQIVARLEAQSATFLLETALAADGLGDPARLAAGPLARAGLAGHRGAARIEIGLTLPLIGLGAPAPVYYPAVAARLGAQALIPDHADVANAIGAVVGEVRFTTELQVTSPSEGLFRLHGPQGPQDFAREGAALDAAEAMARDQSRARAKAAGADDPALSAERDIQAAEIEGQRRFLSATIRATASGRPGLTPAKEVP